MANHQILRTTAHGCNKQNNIYWLVFLTHFEKYAFVNGKDDIPYMKWTITFMFETTNQYIYIYYCDSTLSITIIIRYQCYHMLVLYSMTIFTINNIYIYTVYIFRTLTTSERGGRDQASNHRTSEMIEPANRTPRKGKWEVFFV